jgi:hypothetical protein
MGKFLGKRRKLRGKNPYNRFFIVLCKPFMKRTPI